MICPKCGKDCADAKFCPECGQDLHARAAAKTTEERKRKFKAAGQVYCPQCLSTSVSIRERFGRYGYRTPTRSLAALLIDVFGYFILWIHHKEYGDKYVCLNCGNEWFSKRAALQERHAKHISKLLGEYSSLDFTGVNNSYLRLSENEVIICLTKKKRCIIPYDELAVVDYRGCIGPFYGRLTIRDRANMRKKIPKTLDAAQRDKYTILFAYGFQEGFYQVYSTLRRIAQENKEEGLF